MKDIPALHEHRIIQLLNDISTLPNHVAERIAELRESLENAKPKSNQKPSAHQGEAFLKQLDAFSGIDDTFFSVVENAQCSELAAALGSEFIEKFIEKLNSILSDKLQGLFASVEEDLLPGVYVYSLVEWYFNFPNLPYTMENVERVRKKLDECRAHKRLNDEELAELPLAEYLKTYHLYAALDGLDDFFQRYKLLFDHPASHFSNHAISRDNLQLHQKYRVEELLAQDYRVNIIHCDSVQEVEDFFPPPRAYRELDFISARNGIRLFRGELAGRIVAVKYFPVTKENLEEMVEFFYRFSLDLRAKFYPIVRPIQAWIVCKLGQIEWEDYFCIATPLADDVSGGTERYTPWNLARLIEYGGPVSGKEIMSILSPIVDVLRLLPSCYYRCYHGNISLENILFFDGVAMLTDFGLHCRHREKEIHDRSITMPPELMKELHANNDITLFGLVVYSLLSGKPRECFPEVPVDVLRDPAGKLLNRFVLRCCSNRKRQQFKSFRGLARVWRRLSHVICA